MGQQAAGNRRQSSRMRSQMMNPQEQTMTGIANRTRATLKKRGRKGGVATMMTVVRTMTMMTTNRRAPQLPWHRLLPGEGAKAGGGSAVLLLSRSVPNHSVAAPFSRVRFFLLLMHFLYIYYPRLGSQSSNLKSCTANSSPIEDYKKFLITKSPKSMNLRGYLEKMTP